jgi:hypothetical protein
MSSAYFLFLFTDIVDDEWQAEAAGWGLIGLLALNITVNGIQIAYITVKNIVFKIKLFYLRWLFKKLSKNAGARGVLNEEERE